MTDEDFSFVVDLVVPCMWCPVCASQDRNRDLFIRVPIRVGEYQDAICRGCGAEWEVRLWPRHLPD